MCAYCLMAINRLCTHQECFCCRNQAAQTNAALGGLITTALVDTDVPAYQMDNTLDSVNKDMDFHMDNTLHFSWQPSHAVPASSSPLGWENSGMAGGWQQHPIPPSITAQKRGFMCMLLHHMPKPHQWFCHSEEWAG